MIDIDTDKFEYDLVGLYWYYIENKGRTPSGIYVFLPSRSRRNRHNDPFVLSCRNMVKRNGLILKK